MQTTDNHLDQILPRALSKRAVSIVFVIVGLFFVTAGFIFLSKMLGINPDDVSGPSFVPSPMKIGLSLSFWGMQLAILYLFMRFVHKGTTGDFGFKKSIFKNLLTGFGIGMVFSSALVLGRYYLAYENVRISWNVPAGVSFLQIIPFYLYFTIHLTINSLTEEAIFRCYPIELFRSHPRLIAWMVTGTSVLFAVPHFFLGGFTWTWLVSLVGFSLSTSYLYFYWRRSIWLIIGFHNAANFYQFSLSGNWKLGGLLQMTKEAASHTDSIRLFMTLALYSLLLFGVVYLGRKRYKKHLNDK